MKQIITGLVLFLGLASTASAASGIFCNPQNEIVEWKCQEPVYGRDWVPQADGCYHRNTYRACYDNGGGNTNPDYGQINENTMFKVRTSSATFYADWNGGYCQFRDQRAADRFRRNEYGNRRVEFIDRLPRNLRYAGVCQVY